MKALPDLDEVLARAEDDLTRWRGGRLLITGGTGFVGRWLVDSFLHANHRLRLGARLVLVTRDAGRAPADPSVEVVQADVRRLPALTGFDAVIAGAAASAAQPGDPDAAPRAMTETIVLGTQAALDAARGGRLLLLSSGAVYGPQHGPVAEDAPGAPNTLDPRAVYGQSKRLAETLCSAATMEGQVAAVIARIFTLVGPGLPLDAHFAAGNLLADVLAGRAARVSGDGRTVRSYLYAADLATWLWRLLGAGRPGRAYNVGSPTAVSIRELAEAAAALERPGVPVQIDGGGGAPTTYVPDTARARTELGLEAWTPLPEALHRTLAWHRVLA